MLERVLPVLLANLDELDVRTLLLAGVLDQIPNLRV
jgi:hypothetical protein